LLYYDGKYMLIISYYWNNSTDTEVKICHRRKSL